jgi:hypothetical protein
LKNISQSEAAFSKPRTLIALVLLLGAGVLALGQPGSFSKIPASAGAGKPELVRFSAAISHDKDLRELPYIAPNSE